jgi:hypothetical protein
MNYQRERGGGEQKKKKEKKGKAKKVQFKLEIAKSLSQGRDTRLT